MNKSLQFIHTREKGIIRNMPFTHFPLFPQLTKIAAHFRSFSFLANHLAMGNAARSFICIYNMWGLIQIAQGMRIRNFAVAIPRRKKLIGFGSLCEEFVTIGSVVFASDAANHIFVVEIHKNRILQNIHRYQST